MHLRSRAFCRALPILALLFLPLIVRAAPVLSVVGKCALHKYAAPDLNELNSCDRCEIDDSGILSCLCADETGYSQVSSLGIYSCPKHYAYPLCAGEIKIVNGKLACRRISPESTYDERGCFSCLKEGHFLKCDCVKQGREHVSTALDLRECNAPISNCGGQLKCGLCMEPKDSWIWLQATVVGASAVATALIVVRTFFWKRIFG